MISVRPSPDDQITTLTLEHGKVNALRLDVVEAFAARLDDLETDAATAAVILTGRGPFFSFGFDVPHLLGQSRETFGQFLHAFTGLYTRLFLFPKPVVAAINGHAVAGGWMLAQACDARVVVRGNTKIGLNEVRFGAALFAGSIAILHHVAGGRVADRVAGSGPFIEPDEAIALGLADTLCDRDELDDAARALTGDRYGRCFQPSFGTIKRLSHQPIVDAYRERETPSIERFLDIWFTDDVQASLRNITIRA